MQAAETLESDPHPRDGRRATEASLVLEIVRLTSSTADPRDCFDRVVEAVRTSAQSICHASLLGWDADRGLLTALASSGEWDVAQNPPGAWRPAGGAAEALATSRPWMAGDLAAGAREPATMAPGARSALCVPVRSGGRILALLNLESRRPDRFGPSDAALFEILCEHLAGTMHRFGLHEQIRRRSQQVVGIAEICLRIPATGDIRECLDAAVRALVESCGCDFARVALADEEGRHLILEAHHSRTGEPAPRGDRLEVGEGIAGRAAKERRTVCVNDASSDPGLAATAPGAKAELCVALVAGEELVGVLDVGAREPHAFDREAIGLMETLGAVLALAIDRARRMEGARRTCERLERCVGEAVREKEALQIQLLHSERLSALGQLIGGIAHELNNPLTGVIGYSQLLAESECEERIRKGIEKVYTEARRCHRVVQGLLAFARRHAPEKQYVSINDILESTLELRAYQLRVDDISVVTDLSRDLPRTMADYHQLQQVFLNIVNNAHHAMRDTGKGGILSVRSTLSPGRIRVEFSDTGAGIPPENLNRIFEPFFTTKQPGQGTGLGLSICTGIVEDHKGRILVSSSQGAGTLITVDLPILRREEPGTIPG